jgi:hypothetical protein
MSGKKPPTSLVLRARPDLSDADLAALIVRSNHLFARPRGLFDAAVSADLLMHDDREVDPKGSYLIYCETNQSFIGVMRAGRFSIDGPGPPRFHVVLYPSARA